MGVTFSGFSYQISQLWPPKPRFTEKECTDQTGKVFIVTGASGGVGKELAEILYTKNAKIYVAARNEEKAKGVIDEIKAKYPESKGELVFLRLVLDDLTTIKQSAEEFLSKEERLDVLWNNAGVMMPPDGSKTKQGYELQLGTNCLAPFLFTKLLTPLLIKTAKTAPAGSVRVIWVSSSATQLSPKGGVDMNNLDFKRNLPDLVKYGVSKAGNVLHAFEYARAYKEDGIVSVPLNPGNLKSDLGRHLDIFRSTLYRSFVFPAIYGAYTELFAGLSPDITLEKSGSWVAPWGRLYPLRSDLIAAGKPISEGGTGNAEKFWQWSDEQTRQYS